MRTTALPGFHSCTRPIFTRTARNQPDYFHIRTPGTLPSFRGALGKPCFILVSGNRVGSKETCAYPVRAGQSLCCSCPHHSCCQWRWVCSDVRRQGFVENTRHLKKVTVLGGQVLQSGTVFRAGARCVTVGRLALQFSNPHVRIRTEKKTARSPLPSLECCPLDRREHREVVQQQSTP